jgi:hypothetical protein
MGGNEHDFGETPWFPYLWLSRRVKGRQRNTALCNPNLLHLPTIYSCAGFVTDHLGSPFVYKVIRNDGIFMAAVSRLKRKQLLVFNFVVDLAPAIL